MLADVWKTAAWFTVFAALRVGAYGDGFGAVPGGLSWSGCWSTRTAST